MWVFAAVGAFVALGLFCACGGDSGEAGSTLSGGVDTIGVSQCLSDAGFLLQPSSEAIGGKTPGGTEFEISFYENAEAAKSAQASIFSAYPPSQP